MFDGSDNLAGNKPAVPTPHEGQELVLALRGRYRVAVCGRRFGKTVAAAIAVVRKCQHSQTALRVWWISPIQEQSDRVEREIAYWLSEKIKCPPKRKAPKKEDKSKTQTQDTSAEPFWEHRKQEHALVHHPSLSRIEFHSAHVPDRLRGAGLDLLVVDEAADVSEYCWKRVLKPMLLEAHGEAFILGTPRGTRNWLHNIYLLGQAAENAGTYASIRLPTSANPNISAANLAEDLVGLADDEIRQEYEAEFIDGVDSVFGHVADCVDSGEPALARGRPGEIYITGIDLGEHRDYTVLCSVACRTDRVEGFARFHHLGWHGQLAKIRDYLARFPGPCVVDRGGPGDPIFDAIRRFHRERTEAFTFTAGSKEQIVRGLAMAFDGRTIKLANIPDLIGELQAFKRLDDPGRSSSPHAKYGAPQGLHDDCVMALAMAWWGLRKRGLWGEHTANPFRQCGLFAWPDDDAT